MHSFLPKGEGFPRHPKYVALFGIITFALFSGFIPSLGILHANELEKQKVRAVPIEETHVRKPIQHDRNLVRTQLIALTREKLRVSPIPTPTPTEKVKEEKLATSLSPEPKKEEEKLENTSQSATQQQLFHSLNTYRQKKGKSSLSWDGKLGGFAQSRADQFARDDKMDGHAGFKAMFDNNGYQRMGFLKMGENSSMSDNTDSTYIIESLYAGSAAHEDNQLNDSYTHVGVGVSGKFTNLVFGGKKI